MQRLSKLSAGLAAVAAAALVAAATPALADPPNGPNGKQIVAQAYDLVGVGANTDENLFNQLTADYNAAIPAAKHGATHPYVYSWNATKPGSSSTKPTTIVPKADAATITRPNGSNAGLKALEANQVVKGGKYYAVDFARSSSGRSSAPSGPGGVVYVSLAEDAVSYATRDTGATYAPHSLTLKQLQGIFTCKYSTWGQVGGTKGKAIKAYLPQVGAGTLSFWLKALGITEAGPCVDESLEENQGLSPQFNSPNAIFIYSVADWIAQKYHSPLPGHKPGKAQNKFGTDVVGYLGLNDIDGISPVTSAKVPTINKGFSLTKFTRTIYDVVRWTKPTADHIPAPLEKLISSKALHGFACSNKTAIADISAYGFLPIAKCGATS